MLSKEDLLALEPDFIAAWYSTFSDKRLGDVDFWHERSVGTYMALNSGSPRRFRYLPADRGRRVSGHSDPGHDL
ncbi:MAG: hypothetical protein ACLRNQ_23765 [Flavonifractor plautii]